MRLALREAVFTHSREIQADSVGRPVNRWNEAQWHRRYDIVVFDIGQTRPSDAGRPLRAADDAHVGSTDGQRGSCFDRLTTSVCFRTPRVGRSVLRPGRESFSRATPARLKGAPSSSCRPACTTPGCASDLRCRPPGRESPSKTRGPSSSSDEKKAGRPLHQILAFHGRDPGCCRVTNHGPDHDGGRPPTDFHARLMLPPWCKRLTGLL